MGSMSVIIESVTSPRWAGRRDGRTCKKVVQVHAWAVRTKGKSQRYCSEVFSIIFHSLFHLIIRSEVDVDDVNSNEHE